MIRLCFPYKNVDIKIRSDGSYRVEGLVEYLNEIVDFALLLARRSKSNFSDFYFANSHDECVERLSNNLSDYGAGIYTPYEPSLYRVPIVEWGITLSIFTGYDVNEYQEQLANSTKYTLLSNLRLYDPGIYLLTILYVFIAAIVFSLQTRVNLYRVKNYQLIVARQTVAMKYRRLLAKTISRGMSRDFRNVKCISFLSFLALFFIFLPFSILFKTSQVVNVQPRLVKNYREIMARNVSIYRMDISINETFILQPQKDDLKSEASKFWHYWRRNKVDLSSMKDMMAFRNGMQQMAEDMVKHRSVYFGMYAVVLRSVLCMFSRSPILNNVQVFKDDSTRELIAGFGASVGYKNDKFFFYKRVQVENGLNFYKSLRIPFYGIRNPEAEHFFKQRRICMFGFDLSCKSETFASGIQFFHSAFVLLNYLILLANILLLLEVMLNKTASKKHSNSIIR